MPQTFYNSTGDCFEVLFSDESYYAERVDDLLTVFYGQDSGEIVGALVKGFRRQIKEILKRSPGFKIEFEDGSMQLSALFTARLWSDDQQATVVAKYKKVRDEAQRLMLKADISELSS